MDGLYDRDSKNHRDADIRCRLTVYFEDPFWVGIFEKIVENKLSVSKVTFGAEPKDYEIHEMVERYYYRLKFSPSVEVTVKKDAVSPKRRQRDAKKESQSQGIGTKSQQALQLQREENKLEKKTVSREIKEAEKKRQFTLKQEKRKDKHKGH